MTLPSDLHTAANQRRSFKYFNYFMIGMWRLGLRRWINAWPSVGGRILVIAHRGRKTGLRRLTPVNYAIVDGEIYCTAGFGAVSDWYRNVLVNPEVEVWLPGSRWSAVAEDVSDDPQRIARLRQVLIGSGIVAPIMGLQPRTMGDAQLAEATPEYRLVRLRRTHPVVGPGGPGDLAWIWLPVLAFFGLWMIRCRRQEVQN